MAELIEDVFLPAFGAGERHDSAVLGAPDLPPGARLAITTDGYVVSPLFFPGGDIGRLAVCGTVNDLTMAGAHPWALTVGFILEEGLAIETLRSIVASMAAAARECGVAIVTGDTKVVDRGKGDGVFVTTAGIGLVPAGVDVRPARVRAGDAVLVSGDLGRHGIAILSVREGLRFEGAVESDVAPLHGATSALLAAGIDVHCMRDLTRGGLASAVNEIARAAGVAIDLEEAAVPVAEPVRGACEMLGIDPLYVACEGRMVVFVPGDAADAALAVLSRFMPLAARIGRIAAGPARVTVQGPLGGRRFLDLLSGEQLPRIC